MLYCIPMYKDMSVLGQFCTDADLALGMVMWLGVPDLLRDSAEARDIGVSTWDLIHRVWYHAPILLCSPSLPGHCCGCPGEPWGEPLPSEWKLVETSYELTAEVPHQCVGLWMVYCGVSWSNHKGA